ncbi:MAG: nitroreductase family protein [Herbinix sp.]|nr:nitroreductase family protein [Herbinix sp.]
MTNNQLYEAIFKRKSIRKYDLKPLPAETLSAVKQFANTAKPLDNSIKFEFLYLATQDVKNILPIKAPHYICLYSEKKENYLMNAGFLLQQLDLFLSANNLASCWLGMAKPTKQVPEQQNGLEFVIMLAFGNSNEPIHRLDTTEFIRKSMSDISNIAGGEELLEPVRLAPSASNSQPWFFSGNINEIEISREKLNLIKAPLYGKMNQIDIGIALFHLWLSLDHQGKTANFAFQKAAAPSGYEFMVKVKVKN